MKKIELFHGSDKVIRKPIYGYGNKHNDYGLGFYCTLDKEAGKEWSCRNKDNGVLNKYFLNLDGLKVLDLTDKTKYSVLNWVAILVHNRTFTNRFKKIYENAIRYLEQYYIDVDRYDVIIGYGADDSYFQFPISFLKNMIHFEKLTEIYTLGELGIQYAIKSKKAIESLEFVNYEYVGVEYRYKYEDRINNANTKYDEIIIECENGKGTTLKEMVSQYDKLH